MKMISLIAALLFATAPIMAYAGGPVVTEESTEVEAMDMDNPNSKGWIVPVIIGGVILCAVLCGGDDDPVPPPVVCKTGC